MSETQVRRCGHGEDGIYLDAARNRYMGAVSLGYGPDGKRIRRKISGKTKQEVRDKLRALHQEIESGVRSSRTYTVRETVVDCLREGLDGTSERTRALYEGLLEPVLEMIGARPLGLGEDWVPREMRHTFVSVLSANGVPFIRTARSVARANANRRTWRSWTGYRPLRPWPAGTAD